MEFLEIDSLNNLESIHNDPDSFDMIFVNDRFSFIGICPKGIPMAK